MNVQQIRPDIDVQTLNEEELLMAHMTAHAYYKEFRLGRGKEHWDIEQVVEVHDKIRDEIEQRDGVDHDYISALDNESVEIEAMQVEMGHKESTAESWAKKVIQADDVDQFIKEEPPSADWFIQAQEFIEQEDGSIDLTNHVDLSTTPFEDLSEPTQDWVEQASDEEAGVVGYHVNEQTDTGTILMQKGVEYVLCADTLTVMETESLKDVLQSYNKVVRLIQDGVRAERAHNIINQEEEWTVTSNPESYDLMDPDSEWSDSYTSEEAYLQAANTDAESWDEASEEIRQQITEYHTVSASGEPAASFEDLHGPQFTPEGQLCFDGVVQSRMDNANQSTEWPQDLRDDVDAQLSQHFDQFAEEFEEIEDMSQGDIAVDDSHMAEESAGQPGHNYRWYEWDQDEAETWLENHGFEVTEPTRQANFLVYEQNNGNLFDEFVEWRGPCSPDFGHVPELDGRPILFRLGYVNEEPPMQSYDEASIDAIMFQTERPPDVEMEGEITQAKIMDAGIDYYWYQWNRAEVETFLMERNKGHFEKEEDGEWLKVTMNNPNKYEKVHKTWEGSRQPVDDITAGGKKPRRITYGETENGEKEVQSMEFLIGNPFEDE